MFSCCGSLRLALLVSNLGRDKHVMEEINMSQVKNIYSLLFFLSICSFWAYLNYNSNAITTNLVKVFRALMQEKYFISQPVALYHYSTNLCSEIFHYLFFFKIEKLIFHYLDKRKHIRIVAMTHKKGDRSHLHIWFEGRSCYLHSIAAITKLKSTSSKLCY